jgi:hypothetical protein
MSKPNSNHELLAQLDVLARLHALPEAVALTTSEAAIFLRSSVSALEAMRAKGTGPTYIQGGGKGAAGTNQKCLYEKADLLAWQRAHKVSSTVEAAVRKGQLFATAFDLLQTEAFWVDCHGGIISMVETASISTAVERLGQYEIEWLPVVDAAARPWKDVVVHRELIKQAGTIFRREIERT